MDKTITPFLWFDGQAEEAVNFYVSLFDEAQVFSIVRYESGPMQGKVLTAVFQLRGQTFMALDGGPQYQFTEAVSFFVSCDSQKEVDHLWNALSEGGDESAQQCGWLKDKYGLSWQIIPDALPQLMSDPDPERAQRVMQAMLKMKKIDVAGLMQAHGGY